MKNCQKCGAMIGDTTDCPTCSGAMAKATPLKPTDSGDAVLNSTTGGRK